VGRLGVFFEITSEVGKDIRNTVYWVSKNWHCANFLKYHVFEKREDDIIFYSIWF